MANISAIKLPNGNTYDLVDKTSGYITGMTILSYGASTWQNFIDAYNANKVVYCRASSGSNPASGSQTRLAFMAYVNNATTPTEVEFQYYRSVSTHTASQQGDQVYVYKLNKTNGWSVTTREASVKVVAGTGLGSSYSNGTITLTGPTKTSDLTNDSGFVTTDNKLEISSVSNNSYYPIVATDSTTAAIRQYDNTGFKYAVSNGTTSSTGLSEIILGNNTSVGSVGNKEGRIRLFGPYTGYVEFYLDTNTTSGQMIEIPNNSGTMALTSDIPTVPTNVSAFTNDAGYLTSFTETDPTVPSWAKASSKPSYNFSEIGSTPTTLSGYGITDVSVSSGVITLGSNTITPLTSSSTLSAAKLSGAIPSAVTATTQSASDNSTKIATTAYVTTAIANLPEPMLFKGSVGTGGTITSLPTAAAANEGFTYKVITALTTPVTAKVGDTVISNGSEWVVIPSGDEPSGTVTSVGLTNATNGGLTISNSPITSSGTISVGHSNVLTSAQTTQAVYPIKIDKNGHISEYGSAVTIPTKVSDLTNDSGFITSYTDENMKWTASTSSNTYYPLQSTSTATTSTANTLNGINFYQYYNTAGGYRRLTLGNSTAWKSSGGAYGLIRLYGAAATYYGDLVPGVLGTTSGDGHISANRTWTLPDKTGTVALTSDIPTVSYPVTSVNNKTGAVSLTASDVGALPSSTTIPTKVSDLTNDSGFVTTDENVTSTVGATGTFYLTSSSSSSTTTGGLNKHENVSITISPDQAQLILGGSSRPGKGGYIKLYDSNGDYKTTISTVLTLTADRTLTLPDKSGTVALTSDIPSYTATSPIDITSNNISHEDSGVTAGTYDGGSTKDIGVYFPSFTVDEKGHITSATDLGTLIPTVSNSNAQFYYGNLVTGYQWRYVVSSTSMTDNVMSGSATSATFKLYNYNTFYGDSTHVRVLSVEAVDADGNAVIVDWSVDYPYSTKGEVNYVTLTVSLAEAYGKTLYIKPIVAYGVNPM